jgi:hypothetical protein
VQAKVIHRRDSKLNGDILVEELVVKGAPPGTVVRRMRFMSNLELEQTEVRLVIQADGRAIADREYLPYVPLTLSPAGTCRRPALIWLARQ